MGRQHDPAEVQVESARPLLDRRLRKSRGVVPTGVVDEDVHGGGDRLSVCLPRHIGRDERAADLLRRPLSGVGVDVCDDDRGARTRETGGDRAADTDAAARYDCVLACDVRR
jgi:hypothetical protein